MDSRRRLGQDHGDRPSRPEANRHPRRGL